MDLMASARQVKPTRPRGTSASVVGTLALAALPDHLLRSVSTAYIVAATGGTDSPTARDT